MKKLREIHVYGTLSYLVWKTTGEVQMELENSGSFEHVNYHVVNDNLETFVHQGLAESRVRELDDYEYKKIDETEVSISMPIRKHSHHRREKVA